MRTSLRALILTLSAHCLLLALLPTNAEADEGRHLFILSGQSNMRKPLPGSFYQVVANALGSDRVLIVQTGHPGQPIRGWDRHWQPPGADSEGDAKNGKKDSQGHLYEILIERVKRDISGHTIESVTFVWMQGEADAEKGWAASYEESFYRILGQIGKDLGVDRVHYVIGRINDYWTTPRGFVDGDDIRRLQQKIGEAHPYGDWVNTDDLNTGVNPWGVFMFNDGHFPPSAYAVLGERFAKKAIRLIRPELKLKDELFTARHFERSAQISKHDATGAKVLGSEPEAGSLTALTDGKFAGPDASDRSWNHFKNGKEDGIKLMVDLGKATAIDQVGLSLLHDPDAGFPFPETIVMEVSEDGNTWQSLNRRNFRFEYSAADEFKKAEMAQRQPIMVLVPGPRVKSEFEGFRYFRIHVQAPQVCIDEMIVNPRGRE